jgi:hypothetical protein
MVLTLASATLAVLVGVLEAAGLVAMLAPPTRASASVVATRSRRIMVAPVTVRTVARAVPRCSGEHRQRTFRFESLASSF